MSENNSSNPERVSGHTGPSWRAEGPDMFGDYNILRPVDSLAVAAVISNMRPAAEVAEIAALLIRSVNSHDGLAAALQSLGDRILILEAALKPFGDSCPADDHLSDNELLAIRSPSNGRVFNYIPVSAFRSAYTALAKAGVL